LVCPAILFYLTLGTKIERGSGDVQITLLYHLREIAEEERHNQRVDVRAIDVGIGHDDNFLITQLVYVGFLTVFAVYTEADTQSLNDIVYFIAFECLVPHGFLYVKNLTAQRQDSLESTVTSLFCRTTGRVTLDEEQFAFFRVLAGAVGQFARHTATRHRRLALYGLTCLACCHTCLCRQYHLVYNHFGLFGMLFQVIGERFAYSLVYGSHNFVVAEFRFGLSFKLRFGHLDGDNRGQTFAEVVTGNLYLCLLQHLVVLGVFLQSTGQRTAETCQVSTTFNGIDIVYIRVDILIVGSVVHDGHFYRRTLFFGIDVDNIVHQMFAGRIYIAYKLLQTFYGIENFLLVASVFLFYAEVGQRNFDTGIQISQLTHTGCQDIVIVHGFGKDCIIWPELLACTCDIGSAYFLYRV